jgi:PAS domain S-box-containing protein
MWPISEDRLRDALRHLPVVIYQETHEPEPRTIYLSSNAGRILGAGPDEHLRDPGLWWRSIDPRDQDMVADAWDLAYRTEQPYTLDYRYRCPDGSTVWLRDEEAPVRGDDGRVTHWQGVLLDITGERAARDELTTSEARYRALVEHLPGAVYTMSTDDPPRVLYVSEAIEEICGYEVDRWLADPGLAMDIVHPDDLEEVSEAWADARRTGTPFERSYRIRHADGTCRWLSERIHPIREDGNVVAWEGISFDETREREALLALRESERRHEQLLQQIPGVAFSLLEGPPRRFDYLSPRVQDILGYPRSLWFEEDGFWSEMIHAEDLDAVLREWDRCVEVLAPFRMEYRVLHADGRTVWLRADTVPILGPDGQIERWQGLWLDITEAQEARQEQAEVETRYRRLVEQAPAIVLTTDPDGAVRYISPQVEDVLGHPRERWADDPFYWKRLLHPDDLDQVLADWEEAVRDELPYDGEYRLLLGDGSYRWIRDVTHPVHGADGTVSGWHGLTIDIHDLHVAREALEAAEARARALLENVPAVVYEMGPDDERRTLYVSPHIERLLGYSRQEWLDQPDIWTELLHPDDRETELEAHDRHSATGEPWSREYRLIAADGGIVWVHDQATLASDADGCPVWQGVLVDVSAQNVTTEMLQLTNAELERRVRERTEALEEANELMGLEVGERRRIEAELHGAERRFRELVELSPALIYTWQTRPGPSGEFFGYVSPHVEAMLGYTPEEWHAEWHVWDARLHPHDRDRVMEATLRSEETGEPFNEEYRYLAKDGRVVWVHDHATLLERDGQGRPFLFQGVTIDITARKEAERRATDAETRLRRIAEAAPDVVYVVTLDPSDPTSVSVEYPTSGISALLGDSAIGTGTDRPPWMAWVHPDDRGRVQTELEASRRSGEPWTIDYRVIDAEGKVTWLRDRGRCAERDPAGRPVTLVGSLSDVTDETEQRLRARDELSTLRTIAEETPAVTWIVTATPEGTDPRYLYMSPQVERMLGFTADQLIAERTHFSRMVHPDDAERVDASWRLACRSGAEMWEDRWRTQRRTGGYRWIYARARRVSEPSAETAVWVGLSLDVTETNERQVSPASEATPI